MNQHLRIKLNRERLETEWLPGWGFLMRQAKRLLEDNALDVRYVTDEDAENLLTLMGEIDQAVGRQVLGDEP